MSEEPATCNFGTSTIILNDKPHRCKHCEKRFESTFSLRSHLCAHFRKVLFFCNICKKEYLNESNYKVHLNHHSGERPYVCKICSRRHIRRRYATNHVKYHLFRKPYKCSHCVKGYFRIQDLNHHVRVEHNVKARKVINVSDSSDQLSCKRFYQCKTCRKQFSSVVNRNNHQCDILTVTIK